MIDGGVMKKSVRPFSSVMKRLPVDFPPDAIGKYECDHFLAYMGKLGVRRPVEEEILQTTTLLRWSTGECLQDRGGACSESTNGTRRTESWNPLNDGQVLRNCATLSWLNLDTKTLL